MSILSILGIEDHNPTSCLKECVRCKEKKSIDCFRKRGEGKSKKRISIYCKECESKNNKELRELRKKAPTKPDFCECCGKKTKELVLDHDHKTIQFRGWICDSCNVGISRLGDTSDGVMRAYIYLTKNDS